MPTLCKLLDENGSEIASPVPVEASVSWNVREGLAQAFNPFGKLVAELRLARVEWIEAGGIRIIGVEPKHKGAMEVRAQHWQYDPR